MQTRRQFLRSLLASSALLSCAPKARPGEPIGLPREESVLIIGAGVAGLAAAQALKKYKINVTVIEARERIGGRVFTDRSWKEPIELGASWIHGTRHNPIKQLAKELNLQTKKTDYDARLVYDGDKLLSEKEVEALDKAFWELLEKFEDRRSQMQKSKQPDLTLGNIVQEILPQGTTPPDDFRRLMYTLNAEIEQEYGASVDDMSLFYWDVDQPLRGPDALVLGGYDQIPKKLAEGIDVKLGHAVSRITYGDGGVSVATNQGIFNADRAIITVPLGVLKQGSIAFDPPLPQSKQAAIENVGMGLLDKVCLRFPKAFWHQEGIERLGFISPQNEFSEVYSMTEYNQEPVLVLFNAASTALALEPLREKDIVARAMAALRTMFGDKAIEPEDYKITRWAQDSYSFGSYSYLSYGSSPDSYDALAAPVGDRLFFAGEATIRDYAATVHGAYLSGLREARRWA